MYRDVESDFARVLTRWDEKQSWWTKVRVELGLSPNFVVRWGKDVPFEKAEYQRLRDAVRRVQEERDKPFPKERIHILSRDRGWGFILPPPVIRDISDGTCPLCKMPEGFPCDAGLHS
jgi:hypothetical protein